MAISPLGGFIVGVSITDVFFTALCQLLRVKVLVIHGTGSAQSQLSCPSCVALGEVTARSPDHTHQRCLLVCLLSSWNSKVPVQGQRHFGSLKVHVDPAACQCDTLEL